VNELTLAAVQTSPVFGEVQANVDAALALVPAGCDLAVIPELFASGYQFTGRTEARQFAENLRTGDGYAMGRLTAAARDTGTTLVAGLVEQDGDRLYNSSVLVRPDGSREIYRKVHLFLDEKDIFDPGDLGFPVYEACGTTVGMMICFDWVFPEAARSLALAGAQILLHPSNLLLPWCPEAMKTRCLENRVFAVTANRVGSEQRTGQKLTFIGMSQVATPMGETPARLDTLETGVAVHRISLAETDKALTPRNHLFDDRRPEAYRL